MEKEKTVEEMLEKILELEEQNKTLNAHNAALSKEITTVNKTIAETRELNQKLFLKVSQSQPEPEQVQVDPDDVLKQLLSK